MKDEVGVYTWEDLSGKRYFTEVISPIFNWKKNPVREKEQGNGKLDSNAHLN